MFCALNGATFRPRLRRKRQMAVHIQLFPAWDAVPPTKMALAVILRGWRPPRPGRRNRLPHPVSVTVLQTAAARGGAGGFACQGRGGNEAYGPRALPCA